MIHFKRKIAACLRQNVVIYSGKLSFGAFALSFTVNCWVEFNLYIEVILGICWALLVAWTIKRIFSHINISNKLQLCNASSLYSIFQQTEATSYNEIIPLKWLEWCFVPKNDSKRWVFGLSNGYWKYSSIPPHNRQMLTVWSHW